jgi:hypothetical protein
MRVKPPMTSPRAMSGNPAAAAGRSGASASRAVSSGTIDRTISSVSSGKITGRGSRSMRGTGAVTLFVATRRSA